MRADVGNARDLQQTLNGAVLAVFTVHDREDDVDALAPDAVVSKLSRPCPRTGRSAARRLFSQFCHVPAGGML